MAAQYNGLVFNTPLEAQWAAFFDLANWRWWPNPVAVGNWQPTFKVSFACDHSECRSEHVLYLTVLPVSDLKAFDEHPCLDHRYGVDGENGKWLADGGAAFGNSPHVTKWEISHGAGGGVEEVSFRVPNADALWAQAANLVEAL